MDPRIMAPQTIAPQSGAVAAEPSDEERYPTLSAAGRKILSDMREHPHAPIFRNQSGNRLLAEDIDRLKQFESALGEPPGSALPKWVSSVIADAYADIPFYRNLGPAPAQLYDVPPVSRADLAADIAQFVPDHIPIGRMINFQTTGTTGHSLLIPSHPEVAGRYLSFHKRALRRFGVTAQYGAGQVGVMLLGHQQPCFTYVSVTPTMDESGLIKLNLHPDDWRDINDRACYIDAMQPEFIAGDPLSFDVLLGLDFAWKPRAIMSVSMMLSDGLRGRLEDRFDCPVLDLYSMNEVGPIGVFDAALGGHVLLQDRLWIEILDEEGMPVAAGGRGEITVTGGFNFCLPLLRYRTGDYGALASMNGEHMISGLVGRAPVRFRDAERQWHNNINVTHALKHLPIAQYALHQQSDGALVLSLSKSAMPQADYALAALRKLLGDLPMRAEELSASGKALQYSSDLRDAL